jgi:acyl-CoA synthetase (AMP-forming)/AMP-acid ligase II
VTGEPTTLPEVLATRASSQPDRLAYVDGEQRVSFGELASRVDALAAQLASMGVGPEDRVALAMSAGLPVVETFWAVQRLGAVSIVFNPFVPAELLERRTARIRPRLVLSDGWPGGAPDTEGVVPEPASGADHIAVMQPTSGTSGEPRAVMLTHRNILGYLEQTLGVDANTEDDVLVSWVPPWHDLGLIRFVVAAVFYGSVCHIVQPAVSTIPLWLETVSRERGTITGAPDFAYRLACRMADPASLDLSSLRYAINGGEPVRASTLERFERRFGLGAVVQAGYGLAENTLGVSSNTPFAPHVVDGRGNVSCGAPVPGARVRVSGDAETPGEILVGGDHVFAGYFDAPEETRHTLRDGWLHTGDSGYMDDDGQLFVLGRERAMLNRGGAAVAPRELEEAAVEVGGVRMAAAVSVASEGALTEEIVVVAEAKDAGYGADAIAAAVSDAIAAAAGFAPGRVLIVPPRTVPLTANGKVRYGELRERVTEGLSGTPRSEGAASPSST